MTADLTCPICLGRAFSQVEDLRFSVPRPQGGAAGAEWFSYDILSCDACGHVMTDRPYGEGFIENLYASPLEKERWTHDDREPYGEMIAFARGDLDRALAAGEGRILDIGCGFAKVLQQLYAEGIASERLLAVDFRRQVPDGIPFLECNLNGLDGSAATGFDGYAFAFCTHLLEHTLDPRTFLRALRVAAAPGAGLYLEVPDHSLTGRDVVALSNLWSPQHLHYFTPESLSALATSCGWSVAGNESSLFGFVPRVRLLLRAETHAAAVEATRDSFRQLRALRDALAARLSRESGNGPVAVWGLGTDLLLAIEGHPKLAESIRAGHIVVFDLAQRGQSHLEREIGDPDALAAFDGPIVLAARPANTRFRMREAAVAMGIDSARLIDVFDEA